MGGALAWVGVLELRGLSVGGCRMGTRSGELALTVG